MQESWFQRSFGWIVSDLRRLSEALQRRETWLFIAMFTVFAGIIYAAFQYALRMDFLLHLRNLTANACRELGDGSAALLFVALIFFILALTAAFGELARYTDLKRRQAYAMATSAGRLSAGWAAGAVIIGTAILLLLQSQCL